MRTLAEPAKALGKTKYNHNSNAYLPFDERVGRLSDLQPQLRSQSFLSSTVVETLWGLETGALHVKESLYALEHHGVFFTRCGSPGPSGLPACSHMKSSLCVLFLEVGWLEA